MHFIGIAANLVGMKRIFVITTAPLVSNGLRQFLGKAGYTVVGEASQIAGAIASGPKRADLVIVDAALCTGDIDVLALLRQSTGDRIIVLGNSNQLRSLPPGLIMAADGVLSLDMSCEALRQSLVVVEAGERVTPGWLMQSVMMADAPAPAETVDRSAAPSRREAEMLCLLAEGLSNKLIARELGISEATVKVHLKHLFQKLRFINRTQAALWAQQNLKGQERPRPQVPVGASAAPPIVLVQPNRHSAHKRPIAEQRTDDVAVLPVPDYGQSRMMPAAPQR
ncbi:MAG TPA: LuxR C-terminal-related transcriptional regulator [Stellaceae bacterium]|nr:LuxR C-terminal-related transcriptional regulator [Stellaceae bacterium]